MTPARRIMINVAVSYGRSLLALVCGLFTARWVLESLGKSDYGLYGVIGGMTAFVSFLNSLLAFSVGRFYAFEVGRAKRDFSVGIECCRMWFNTALMIHVLLALILVSIGYPIGVWAIRSFLVIPLDRVLACLWVWKLSCISCFASMVSVPFQAMYVAKQEIAELTLYSIGATVISFAFAWYMVSNSGDWLVPYAACMCVTVVLPQMLICLRALCQYSECAIVWRYMLNWGRVKDLVKYAGSRTWTGLAIMLDTQGQSLLVNKYLGTGANATVSIGNAVAMHSQSLSSALSGAFWPAVANAAGGEDVDKMRVISFRACKFGTLLLLIFVLPLAIEIKQVMVLWLKDPPEAAPQFCLCVLGVAVLEKITDGHWMSIMSLGRIAKYSFFVGLAGLSSMFFAWLALGIGYGVVGVGIARFVGKFLVVIVRLIFARLEALMSIKFWLTKIFLPLFLVSVSALLIGCIPRIFMAPSLCRVCLTTVVLETVLLPMSWWLVLSIDERSFIKSKAIVFTRWAYNER